jgi:hypothetical protein
MKRKLSLPDTASLFGSQVQSFLYHRNAVRSVGPKQIRRKTVRVRCERPAHPSPVLLMTNNKNNNRKKNYRKSIKGRAPAVHAHNWFAIGHAT